MQIYTYMNSTDKKSHFARKPMPYNAWMDLDFLNFIILRHSKHGTKVKYN